MDALSLLIVDDDEEFLEILTRRFQRRGYCVAAGSDVPGSLQLAQEFEYHAAIIDRSLPGGDDLELLRSLKEVHPDRPVIVLSGWSDRVHVQQATDAGACEYLAKPCSLTEIEAAVERALGLRRAAAEPAGPEGRYAPVRAYEWALSGSP